jgi:hypothetical protein
MEYWFRNSEGYFGCDDAACGSNSSASNVKTAKSRSLALTQAKVERDVVFGDIKKSLLGNMCANVFTNGKYMKIMPMASWKEAAELLIDFTDDVGIPETLVMNGATEFTGRKNQNHVAEWEIGFLLKRWKLRMQKKNVYSRLWDYGLVYEGEMLTRMSRGDDSRSGYEQVTGETPDISKWLDFEFYDLLWWWD